MLLQTKIISFGFAEAEKDGLSSQRLPHTEPPITLLKLNAGSGFRLGSAVDPQYPRDVNSASGTNIAAAELGHGIPVTDLNAIFKYTGIVPPKIHYVLGGTNLFWQKADAVYYQNKFYRKPISFESRWHSQPLYFFSQDSSGQFGINLFKPYLGKPSFPPDLNIAVSGRPVLLNGKKLDLYNPLASNGLSPAEYFFLEDDRDARHLVKLPIIKDKEGEKHFLGMEYFKENPEQLIAARQSLPITISYKDKMELFDAEEIKLGLLSCYPAVPQRWQLDTKRAEIYFPSGLDKNKYPHNVLAVDGQNNAYFIQFHGLSGRQGVTIEELQSNLLDLKLDIQAALITSNGLDVFLYDVRNRLYFSC
jgi:hypothetical protein